jgi:hypothetical protein
MATDSDGLSDTLDDDNIHVGTPPSSMDDNQHLHANDDSAAPEEEDEEDGFDDAADDNGEDGDDDEDDNDPVDYDFLKTEIIALSKPVYRKMDRLDTLLESNPRLARHFAVKPLINELHDQCESLNNDILVITPTRLSQVTEMCRIFHAAAEELQGILDELLAEFAMETQPTTSSVSATSSLAPTPSVSSPTPTNGPVFKDKKPVILVQPKTGSHTDNTKLATLNAIPTGTAWDTKKAMTIFRLFITSLQKETAHARQEVYDKLIASITHGFTINPEWLRDHINLDKVFYQSASSATGFDAIGINDSASDTSSTRLFPTSPYADDAKGRADREAMLTSSLLTSIEELNNMTDGTIMTAIDNGTSTSMQPPLQFAIDVQSVAIVSKRLLHLYFLI